MREDFSSHNSSGRGDLGQVLHLAPDPSPRSPGAGPNAHEGPGLSARSPWGPPDALVMGACRHDAWIAWALGETSRYILAHARALLLLAY